MTPTDPTARAARTTTTQRRRQPDGAHRPSSKSAARRGAASLTTSRKPWSTSSKLVQPGAVVAIGDVHGCASLLEEALEPHLGTGVELIFLGDLIDRSPEPDGDRRVLERVWQLQADPAAHGLAAVTVLRGNHEQMLLDALTAEDSDDHSDLELWCRNGGDRTLLSFVGDHRSWFASLPHTAIRGRYLFVHAGVRPGVALEDQRDEDLIWIRKPFLNSPHGLPYTVVHGHTITADHQIERLPHRIGIDTGAFCSGKLTTLRLDTSKASENPPT